MDASSYPAQGFHLHHHPKTNWSSHNSAASDTSRLPDPSAPDDLYWSNTRCGPSPFCPHPIPPRLAPSSPARVLSPATRPLGLFAWAELRSGIRPLDAHRSRHQTPRGRPTASRPSCRQTLVVADARSGAAREHAQAGPGRARVLWEWSRPPPQCLRLAPSGPGARLRVLPRKHRPTSAEGGLDRSPRA